MTSGEVDVAEYDSPCTKSWLYCVTIGNLTWTQLKASGKSPPPRLVKFKRNKLSINEERGSPFVSKDSISGHQSVGHRFCSQSKNRIW